MTIRKNRLILIASLLIVSMSMMAVSAACSSADETPVPPTPLPTSAPDATQTPDPVAPTQPPATATSAATAVPTSPATATPDPDDALYIMTLLATGEIDPNRFTKVPPGDASLLDRAFPGAPPLVPHRSDDLVITAEKNSCMSCHETGKTINGDVAVQVPISHYTEITSGTVTGQLQGRRYVCTSCHVPQVIDEPPPPVGD